MQGNKTILSFPRGVQKEGKLAVGNVKPGMHVTLLAATQPNDDGSCVWEPYNRNANGDRALIALVVEWDEMGHDYNHQYVPGDRIKIYFPLPGEECNIRVSHVGTGTGDHIFPGDRMILVDGVGTAIATTGSPQSEPWQATEYVADVVSGDGTGVCCVATGQ